MRKMKEKPFETKCRRYLDRNGAYQIKYWGCQYTVAGVPDVLVCLNGRYIGIEMKGDTGRPSDLQLIHIDRIRAAGGYAFVLYPSAFDRFKAFVQDVLDGNFPDHMTQEVIWK